jgi:hypothetical protein
MFVSDAKLDANRQNAQSSTGPVTPEGKKRSSLNATRHGLTGQVNIITEEDRKAYDSHCASFFHDWQPQGATEKHLVQTVAAKQWQMHHADAMLQSIYALGQHALADKVDIEHPQIHDALTAGMFTMQKSRELDLIGRYASRLQRDFRNALKDLQNLQAQRKQREKEEMADAALIAKVCEMKEEPFYPSDFGFVLRLQQIDFHLRREQYLAEANIAAQFGFNLRLSVVRRVPHNSLTTIKCAV